MVQSYSPGCAHEGTSVPPGEYNYFGPLESTTQTTNRSVQPFSQSSRQSAVGHIGTTRRIRFNLCTLASADAYDWTCASFLRPNRVHKQNCKSIGQDIFCTAHGRKSLFFTRGSSFPQNFPLPYGDLATNLWFLGTSEPTTQTASVQRSLHTRPYRLWYSHICAEKGR